MHHDITARSILEGRLRTQEALQLQLLDPTADGILALDPHGICTFCNLAATELLGFETPEEMVGKSFPERHHHSSADGTPHPFSECKINRASQLGEPAHADDEVFFRRDGTRFPGEYWSQPLCDESGVIGSVVTIRALTAGKCPDPPFPDCGNMEPERSAQGMAHDFRNILSVIAGYSQLVEERFGADEKGRGYAHQIGLAAKRAAVFTDEMLRLNRNLLPVLLNLNVIVNSAERGLRRMIGQDVTLTIIREPKLRPARTDPWRIERVLMNLAANAMDAMPNGGELVIQTSNADSETHLQGLPFNPAGYVMLRVSDNGCGMHPVVLDRIFEPFFTTKDEGKGIGLGLSIVYRIVEQSGGRILVHSEPGIGTSFTVYLPVVGGIPGPRLRSRLPEKPIRAAPPPRC